MKLTLKAARVNKGLTQEQASRSLNVTVDRLKNWETGRSFPSVLFLPAIEKLYGVSYNDLIFLPENNPLRVNESEK